MTTKLPAAADSNDTSKKKGKRFLPHLEHGELSATEDTISKYEGRIFDFRRKHSESSGESKTVLVDKDGNELTLKWDKEFGRPDTTAYLLLQALFHKSTREGHPFTDTVTFHQEELWKLMGREQTGGRQNKDVANAIAQLAGIKLTGVLYDPVTRHSQHQTIEIFSEQFFVKDEGKRIKFGVLHWSPYIVRGMNNGYWHAFNYDRIKGAGAVQFALYKQLHFHFSNLAAHRVWQLKQAGNDTPDNITRALTTIDFKKDIDDLFTSFFGGIQAPKYLAHIRAEYGDRFDELIERGIIRGWKAEKNAKGDGHNLVFSAGRPFAEDWLELNSTKSQPKIKFQNATEQAAILDPMALVVFFHQTLSGATELDQDSFHPNEFAFAQELIEKRSMQDAQQFITWAVEHARKIKYRVRQLDGLRSLVNEWLAARNQAERVQAKHTQQLREQERDAQLAAFDAWTQRQVQAALAALATDDREQLTALCLAEVKPSPSEPAKLIERAVAGRLKKLMADRLRLPNFEDWRAQGLR